MPSLPITGFDISIVPGFLLQGLLTLLFILNFVYNIFVLWLMVKLEKMKKFKLSSSILPMLAYTIVVGLAEIFALILFLFSDLGTMLETVIYGILCFLIIFFTFRIFAKKYLGFDKAKVNKFALIMGIFTNPLLLSLVLGLLKLLGVY